MELTVSEHSTVAILKEEACTALGLPREAAAHRRLRLTNWLEEPGQLVPEVQTLVSPPPCPFGAPALRTFSGHAAA